MRPASEDHEIDCAVDADMDGKGFSNRRVVARQDGKAAFNMSASFHAREQGLTHQMPMPDVPQPDGADELRRLYRAASRQGEPGIQAPDPAAQRIRIPPGGRTDARSAVPAASGPGLLLDPCRRRAASTCRRRSSVLLRLDQRFTSTRLGLSCPWRADRYGRLPVGEHRPQHVVSWRCPVR